MSPTLAAPTAHGEEATAEEGTADPQSVDPYNRTVSGVETHEPRILERPEHPISRKLIDRNAVKVLYRLHNSGHKAYLVGGGVRDLMLDRRPKDFDVSTDARPNELRKLFRNARIIGRRFRLAHVLFREGVVEVSTFRREPDPEDQDSDPGDRLITSDNTYGTPREDAFRRDFTINALFYNIADFSVIDYVGGIEDLERRLIRVIGDPAVRFQEDPVRMLRACEFAGRLGFTIERATQEAIQAERAAVLRAAPPRLTEELLDLLRGGHVGASIQWMLDLGLLEVLLPEALAMLETRRRGAGEFGLLFPVLDRLQKEGRELPDTVLLAAVLLPQIMLNRFEAETAGRKFMPIAAFQQMVRDTMGPFLERFQIANHKRLRVEQILDGFHRLCGGNFTPGQRLRFASRSHFDETLQLFEILVEATGEGKEVLAQWKQVARQRGRRPEPKVERKRRPRRRRRRRRRS